MSKGKQFDFNRGDLVRVAPGWPRKPEEHFAIVADTEPHHLLASAAAGLVPVRNVNRPTEVNWVKLSRLELVQRGGQ